MGYRERENKGRGYRSRRQRVRRQMVHRDCGLAFAGGASMVWNRVPGSGEGFSPALVAEKKGHTTDLVGEGEAASVRERKQRNEAKA
ncbi:hypothetical protein U1Q18_012094 [Sarracenia purpurea var. burkii]